MKREAYFAEQVCGYGVWRLSFVIFCVLSLLPPYVSAATPIGVPQGVRVFDTPSDGGGSLTVQWPPSAWDGPEARYQVLVGDAAATDPFASSLAAALLDDLFAHPAGLFSIVPNFDVCDGYRSHNEFFRSLLERWEIGKRFASVMLVATPLTEERSRFDICVGWNFLRGLPVGWLVRRTLRTILGQDRDVLELQEQRCGRQGRMLLNLESDALAVWYRQLKKYHVDTLAGVTNPQHPVPEKVTLSWIT
ncbi:MAG: hypothetical protein HP496_06180 [Nitrospira sp.]|nr:hypothetical protein [Nitrospira sp.]